MSNLYIGMDVHQSSLTVTVLPAVAAAPTRVDLYLVGPAPNHLAVHPQIAGDLASPQALDS